MKHLFKSLAALALVASMVGCSKESSEEQLESTTQVELKLKGNIASLKPSTRVDASGFVNNDEVGVYVSSTGVLNSSNNMLDNVAFTYSSGNLNASVGNEVYWGSPNVRLSVWAYYPYDKNAENNLEHLFAVNTDQSTGTNFYNSDFITAQASNLEPQSEPVNLKFNHSLSKIAVTLSKGGNATDDEWNSAEKNLLICDAVVDGSIDLATGIATAGTLKADVKSLANEGTYFAIVYPQKGEIAFRLEMDDDIYIYTAEVEYKAGYQYDYEFTVDMYNPQQLSLDAVSITPWNNEGEPEKGKMSDIITFADSKFKEYLLQEVLYTDVEVSSSNPSKPNGKIDANNDGEISYSEAKSVKYIKVWKMGISDMRELKYFPNLVSLDCAANKLSTLDVSNNRLLEYLNCEQNEFTSLDVSNNTALKWLSCEDNRLTTLDVSNNINLGRLECFRTDITSLDVSNNTVLKHLDCGDVNITTLDVTQNTLLEHLQFGSNQVTAIDVSRNTELVGLYCGNNQLTSIDVSQNTKLVRIELGGNKLTSLDVSNNMALETLICTPMNDINGNNLLETIYVAEGQEIDNVEKPDATEIEVK